jgi:hypothetical protein
LIVDDKILKTENINISTEGWQAMVDGASPDSLPRYVSSNDIYKKANYTHQKKRF